MLARLRFALARHRSVHRLLVLAVALVPGAVVWQQTTEARAARDAWGTRRTVLVAVHAVSPGGSIGPGDVAARPWPAALVPTGSLDVLPPGGLVAAAPIAAGEPLVPERLGDAGRSALAALVPSGARAVAVPRGEAALPLVVGDRVDVLAAPDPAGPASVAARAGTVIHVDDRTAVVAVQQEDTGAVAAAVTAGVAVLVLA